MTAPIDQSPQPGFESGPYSGLNARSAKRSLEKKFRAAGLPFSHEDALDLVMAATGLDETAMIINEGDTLSPEISAQIFGYAQRRLSGEPVDHILGWRDFYGRRFKTSRDVLSPRADTEILITHSLKAIADIKAPRLLDLGTGSGAILITLLSQRCDATGTGVDISDAALSIARENALDLQVGKRAAWLQGSWFSPLPKTQRFDAIISNPPYITKAAMQKLEREVSTYDPHIALQGGDDGLEAYREILGEAKNWLTPNGWLGCEIGYDQNEAVQDLFSRAGFSNIQSRKDMGGHDRIIFARNE